MICLMQTSLHLRKHLHSQDAKDDKEGAADEDDVPDGPQRGDEGLHDQLQSRGAADHPGKRKHRVRAAVQHEQVSKPHKGEPV